MANQYSAVALLLKLSGDWSYMNSKCPTDMNTSAIPCSQNWGTSQKTLKGTVAVGRSSKPCSMATLFRLISTREETRVARMLTAKPTPMRWRQVMPEGFLVKRRAKGMRRRS